ncbi:NAD-dependent epimerase/dehydratase family protein [Streptomyces sp. NPDC006530]|uniref:NAD-dependent epimerase/dehydratase family protein n=1 Tax=Streptomyces sp. NPDC006530 TaxID=3364750 RepID=UPI0036CDAF4A
MRVLMLGGTEFVGRAVTEAALARGHEVTVFHRGRHEPPADALSLHGDRTAEGGLAALAEGSWDVVVDTWSGAPAVVRDAARLLAGRVGHYVYVSSRSVYAHPTPPDAGEDAPLVAGSPDDGDAADYPRAKRGGELAAVRELGEHRALLVRAGLILGPWENIGRLPWWLARAARGGDMLAPGPRDAGIQYIDCRDLARWTLDAAEAGLGGAYDLVSPVGHATMGALIEACVRVTGGRAVPRWTGPETILAAGIEPWLHLPVWIPPGEQHDTMHGSTVAKALAAGLRCRPVQETVADTWAWLDSIGGAAPQRQDRPRVGLDPEVERKVLAGRPRDGEPS